MFYFPHSESRQCADPPAVCPSVRVPSYIINVMVIDNPSFDFILSSADRGHETLA